MEKAKTGLLVTLGAGGFILLLAALVTIMTTMPQTELQASMKKTPEEVAENTRKTKLAGKLAIIAVVMIGISALLGRKKSATA